MDILKAQRRYAGYPLGYPKKIESNYLKRYRTLSIGQLCPISFKPISIKNGELIRDSVTESLKERLNEHLNEKNLSFVFTKFNRKVVADAISRADFGRSMDYYYAPGDYKEQYPFVGQFISEMSKEEKMDPTFRKMLIACATARKSCDVSKDMQTMAFDVLAENNITKAEIRQILSPFRERHATEEVLEKIIQHPLTSRPTLFRLFSLLFFNESIETGEKRKMMIYDRLASTLTSEELDDLGRNCLSKLKERILSHPNATPLSIASSIAWLKVGKAAFTKNDATRALHLLKAHTPQKQKEVLSIMDNRKLHKEAELLRKLIT